jgi:hypothetical protein
MPSHLLPLDHMRPPSPLPLAAIPLDLPPPSQSGKRRHCGKGSMDDLRRKERAKAKRSAERLATKLSLPYGEYAVKPQVINKYIRYALPISVRFDAKKLRHTKTAYTGCKLGVVQGEFIALKSLLEGTRNLDFVWRFGMVSGSDFKMV